MASDDRTKRKDPPDPNSTMEIRLSLRRKLTDSGSGGAADDDGSERRSGRDRRGWHPMPEAPFLDSNGVLVSRDRRKVPERRVSNIRVNWRADED
jgi:hypothetical protein